MNSERLKQVLGGPAAAEISRDSDMQSALNDLSQAHDYLDSRVNRLTEKLQMIMRPEGPTASGKEQGAPPSSPVVDTLRSAAAFIKYQANRLDDLIDRTTL